MPGFFVNRNGDWEAAFYPSNEGYLCPVVSADRKISGFQIRLDQPWQKRKYIWFTSSGLEGGNSSKSPAGLSGEMTGSVVRVTEEILKAEIACRKSGHAYIGNPGVSNYKGLSRMLETLKERGLKTVLECYDMDKMLDLGCRQDYDSSCIWCELRYYAFASSECPKKRQKRDTIRKGCLKLYEMCGEFGLICHRVEWDIDGDGMWLGN